jgi:predicted RNA methylase
MGFSGVPPRNDTALAIRSIDVWSQRSDAALVLTDPPWAQLLAGQDPEFLVRALQLGLVTYYRSKGLHIIGSVDPTDGLDRSGDAPALRAAGRSLREPAVRELYRRYVGAFVSVIRPEALAVASETNLVRALAPAELYAALVAAGNAAAAEARARDAGVRLFVSVQVETAQGRLGSAGSAGVARDLADFPFTQALGLSSYPYLGGFSDPSELPLDYYALPGAPALPLLVLEGGWPSASLGTAFSSSPDEQLRYIERHARLLDAARASAWFQITFADIDLAAAPPPAGSILPLFASLGLVDANLQPKPALGAWDAAFARPYAP